MKCGVWHSQVYLELRSERIEKARPMVLNIGFTYKSAASTEKDELPYSKFIYHYKYNVMLFLL